MDTLIGYLTTFFEFISSQLVVVANFFTTSNLGMIILGLVIFSFVADIFLKFITRK